MKVSELIAQLKKLPQNSDVLVNKEIKYSWNYSESGHTEYELSDEFNVEYHSAEGTIILQ